ncbi:MAG TPA: bifunctional DNA primase/polymerase [Pseudonocardia sp.]|jgi:hypothetical protein|nr:bifunctional DNA primase/polymerase [Pseudonocardia sp.]
MTSPTRQLLHAAQRAADTGLYVFPVTPLGKVPAITRWEQRATRDRRQLATWWTRPFNIGAAVGRSNLVVIDLDVARDDEDRPAEFAGATGGRDVLAMLAARAGHPAPFDTYTVSTPSGGSHLYYRAPAGRRLRNTSAVLGFKIDSRGQGGFVVAPGSVGRHGRYRVSNPAPIAELPDWLANALIPPPSPAPAAASTAAIHPGRAAAYLAAIIERESTDLAHAAIGTRHHSRLAAARTLGRLVGGGELTENDAYAALWEAARRHIGHDCTEREVIRDLRDGLAFGQRAPRRVTGSDQRV